MTILLIVLVGFVLRLISLNQSFWLDEATSALVSRDLTVNQIFTKFLPGDFHPPLYYLIMHYWVSLFGSSEVTIRMFSILAGLGTIFTTYLIAKEIRNTKHQTLNKSKIINSNYINFLGFRISGLGFSEGAALLLATSGLHIYYSQEARMYSLATLFVSLTFLFFVKIIKKGRAGEWLLFSIFLTLSVFTDYLPILIIPAMWVFAWIIKKDFSWWKKFSASHIILIGTGLLWLPTFVKQLTGGLLIKTHSPSWWQILGQTNFKQLILIPTKFIFGRIDMQANLGQIAIVSAAFLFFGFLLFKSLKDLSNPLRGKKIKVVWFWFIVPIIFAGIISFWIPVLSYFRFLFVLPAFYVLVAYSLNTFPKRVHKLSLVLLVTFNLVTSFLYLFNYKNHREDWRGLTSFIRQESLGKKSAVIFAANSQKEAYLYYDKDAKISTPETLNQADGQIWLMRYVQEVFDQEDRTRSMIEDLGYKKTNEYDFNGVVVWRYERKVKD